MIKKIILFLTLFVLAQWGLSSILFNCIDSLYFGSKPFASDVGKFINSTLVREFNIERITSYEQFLDYNWVAANVYVFPWSILLALLSGYFIRLILKKEKQ